MTIRTTEECIRDAITKLQERVKALNKTIDDLRIRRDQDHVSIIEREKHIKSLEAEVARLKHGKIKWPLVDIDPIVESNVKPTDCQPYIYEAKPGDPEPTWENPIVEDGSPNMPTSKECA